MTDDERLETTDLWPDLLAAIEGGKTPAEVAEEHGLARAALTGALRRSGAQGRRRIVRRVAAEEPPAAEEVPVREADVAEDEGRPTPGLERVAEHHAVVGVVPDHVVAENAGVSVGTVRNYRKAHGISGAPRSARGSKKPKARASNPTKTASAKRAPRMRRGKPTPGLERVAAHHHLVGVEPDSAIAEKANVSVGTVRNYRKLHGIAGAPRSRAAAPLAVISTPPPTPSAPPPARPAVEAVKAAWRVSFVSGEVRIGVGETLVDVAERAERSGLGAVERLERIGVVLGE